MSSLNISQQPTVNYYQLPSSMLPVPVSKQEIQALVSWITCDKKVSWLDAAMVYETPCINACIKLGLLVEKDAYLYLAGIVEQVVIHTETHLLQTAKHYTETCGFFEELPKPTTEEIADLVFGATAPNLLDLLVGFELCLAIYDLKEIRQNTYKQKIKYQAKVNDNEYSERKRVEYSKTVKRLEQQLLELDLKISQMSKKFNR